MSFLSAQLRQRPSVKGMGRLIHWQLQRTRGEGREDLLILRDLTAKLLEGRPIYRCQVCGFEGKSLYWQCPSCKRWNTVKPIHGVEAE